MFTGIIEAVGRIARVERRGDVLAVVVAQAGAVREGLAVGGSVSVSGCCLTAVQLTADGFACDVTAETLARTRFGRGLAAGDLVNLERPMRADGRFDGHIVQGHVDGVGHVRALTGHGESADLEVEAPAEVSRYLVDKGSVAVEGVSLTVARRQGATFTIALIPHTLQQTNLRALRAGDAVNLEADVIAKYVERLLPRS